MLAVITTLSKDGRAQDMAGYVVTQIRVKDKDTYDAYRKQVLPTIESFGGEFLVRGGEFTVIEGEWPWPRVVVIRFPSVEKAHDWYNSDAYTPLRQMRMGASEGNLIIVEGT
jgi:uncharacterized protein (DUF1330 family)